MTFRGPSARISQTRSPDWKKATCCRCRSRVRCRALGLEPMSCACASVPAPSGRLRSTEQGKRGPVACVQEDDRDDVASQHRDCAGAIEGGQAMKSTSGSELAKRLGISPARGMEAVMKAQLITAVLKGVEAQRLTHAEVAKRSGLPRKRSHRNPLGKSSKGDDRSRAQASVRGSRLGCRDPGQATARCLRLTHAVPQETIASGKQGT